MKTNGLIFVSCLAAGALIASPAIGKPAKKSSVSKSKRVAPQTTQVTRHNQNIGSRTASTRYYGNRSYAGRQYNGTRYVYRGTGSYANYYGGGRNYYGGNYPYYSSNLGYGLGGGYYPYSYYGGYPYSGYNNYYSYYGGYPYNGYTTYSYYTPTYRYNGSTVAAVQQRLGRLGYYHGVVDGIMGPQTRNAIAAFESRNGLGVDGTISRPLLDSLGLA